ncbi:MAG: twin-arginine translocase subunit TatC, partial [Pirellulaceae bacterium]
MAKMRDDDLFASSTMTFGEHLEELRVCLTRAIIGLVIGCFVGLFFAAHVVRWIESPVLAGLKDYMVEKSKDELRAKYNEEISDDMVQMIDERVMVVEDVYLERSQLARLAAAGQAEEGTTESNLALTSTALNEELPPPTMDLVKTRLWRAAEAKIQALSPYESFMIYLKAAMVVGVVLASPYIFLQIWTFVAAGLYPHEKGYVYIFLPISLLLFLAGASLAFFFVFGPVLDFLFSYNRSMNIAPDMRISDIISFVLMLPLGFGASFQLPLVMLFLNRIGVLSLDAFVGKWRIAILVIFIISMVLTPSGDPISMSLMAVPLTALYFLGLAMIKWMPHGRNPYG